MARKKVFMTRKAILTRWSRPGCFVSTESPGEPRLRPAMVVVFHLSKLVVVSNKKEPWLTCNTRCSILWAVMDGEQIKIGEDLRCGERIADIPWLHHVA